MFVLENQRSCFTVTDNYRLH